MRMDFKVFIFVLAVWAATPVFSWWSWGGRGWSETKPSDCPSNDTETHVCRHLYAANALCITIKCCRDFAESENYIEYDGDEFEDDDDDNSTHHHVTYDYTDNECNLCALIRYCVVYKCYDSCCDGYEKDAYGACTNATGGHECQNGGTKMNGKCECPQGFTGTSCEMPICHCENGECVVKDGKPYCNCSQDYYGENCEHAHCSLECLNGGSCYKQGGYEKCLCPEQYIGKYCEQHFVSPETCPAHQYPNDYCQTRCVNDDGCYGNKICCKEGCSTVCRRPVMDHCEHNGRVFQIGESYKPTPCEDCTCTRDTGMMCRSMSCAEPRCPNGERPVVKPGECCPSCPEEPHHKPPTMYNCNLYQMYYVNTTKYSEYAELKSCRLGIYALDENGDRLEVRFRPRMVQRFKTSTQRPTIVTVTATDSNGRSTVCTIAVTVRDIYSPEFLTCPGDIYVFDGEQALWVEPKFTDNVGIDDIRKYGKGESGDIFEIGEHKFVYRIRDFDHNIAECFFRVIVTDRNTDFEDMPTGLKQRSRDTATKVAIIVAPIIGGIALLAIIITALCCVMRRRAQQTRSTRTSSRSMRSAYDNNIYDLPADVTDKPDKPIPPAYSELPLPQNPPAYSRTGSFRGSVYESEAPPSYSNPEYDTVGEGMKPIETITR